MKILLAIDGSPYSKKMLAYLCAHDELINAGRNTFTALTVLPAIPPRARAVLSKEMVDEYYREEGAKVLDPVRKYLEQSCIFPKERLEVGHPGDIIASIAEDEKYDLIIMGTHGRKGIDRILFGSVAEKIVKSSVVPVMTVRPVA